MKPLRKAATRRASRHRRKEQKLRKGSVSRRAKKGDNKNAASRSKAVRKKTAFPLLQESPFYRIGWSAGREDAALHTIESGPLQKITLNRYWVKRVEALNLAGEPWSRYINAARGYVQGFMSARKKPSRKWLLLPTYRSVAVIVNLGSERKHIGGILKLLNRLPIDEVFIIVNGSSNPNIRALRSLSRSVIICYPQTVGQEISRAAVSKMAKSELLLVLDGDHPLEEEQLIRMIHEMDNGLDPDKGENRLADRDVTTVYH
ncbi:glycosyltransferase family 2 protein [Paenibacillus sp. H1-7]|uniref:glycosyltransferase family A protein n=1 Tax=Paenibacillus sp. H1-7 TaxID=2282849 RepID=UPI001EF767FF|nr:glycosyltransferase family A protein [Paenibacillus sp. H1-7]ULL17958.1 glycosyltransferase family 2 protein [Paenibacillus sp. H1-7]